MSTRAIQHLEAGRGSPYADSARRLATALGLVGSAREAFEHSARRTRKPRHAQSRPGTSATGPTQHNLPTSPTSFVGREHATRELRRLLRTCRLLTLVGVGGAGKTRLALEVAAGVLDKYRDGVWLVELAPLLEGGLVAQQVASVLQVPEAPGLPAPRVLAEALRERRLLIVLDNCEHVLSACASLADALLSTSPNLHILATSRGILGLPAETIWHVTSLSLPTAGPDLDDSEAARLFVERARAASPAFAPTPQNRPAIARVCVRLDGIPLALELAAARVRSIGVAELANRLDDCFGVLTGNEAGRPARQRTLRATVDWSYELLGPREQAVFAHLSVFSGGCSLEAIEAVCARAAGSADAVVDVLEHLVDNSLVIAEPRADGSMRYRLLETLRQYATERLDATEAAADVRTRHADYFCQALPCQWQPVWWGPDLARRISYVELELDNLRAAMLWLIRTSRLDAAFSLGYALGPFWLMSARVSEGHARLAELAAALPEDAQPTPTRAGLVVWSGGLATQDGDYGAGREALLRGLALARECHDDLAQAFALMWLAIGSGLRREAADAHGYAAEGLRLSRASGYRALEGMCLRVLAHLAFESGQLEDAWRLAEEGLHAGREAEHPPSVAWALETLGMVRFRQGMYDAARSLFEESLAQGRGRLAAAIRQNTIVLLALVALERGDLAEASARTIEALEMLRSLPGARASLALPLEAMAQVAAAAGQPIEALRLAGSAAVRRQGSTVLIAPSQQAQLDRWLARARDAIGESNANAAWLAGQALSAEDAIVEARAIGATLSAPG